MGQKRLAVGLLNDPRLILGRSVRPDSEAGVYLVAPLRAKWTDVPSA